MILFFMRIRYLFLSLFLLSAACGGEYPAEAAYDPGLVWEDGIEPGTASTCEATGGGSCIWVDCDAVSEGVGSHASPYDSFDDAVGYLNAGESYITGDFTGGGDYLYIKGTCSTTKHVNYTHEMIVDIRRDTQCGTSGNPSVIKSWKGTARAVFDLENSTTDAAISVRGFTGACDGIVIQNIEVKKHNGTGILIHEYVTNAQLISNYVHGGNAAGNGVEGSIVVYSQGAGADAIYTHVIRNNHLYNNDNSPTGGQYNQGGISLIYDSSFAASNSSTNKIYGNIVDTEVNCIRDKHSGVQNVEFYENLIKNCSSSAIYLRGRGWDIHHNVFHDITDTTFLYSPENQTGAVDITIRNNTVVDGDRFIQETSDSPTYAWVFDVHDNLYKDNTITNVITLAEYGGLSYTIGDWSSSYNYFDFNTVSTNFLIHETTAYNFANGKTQLSDTTSSEVAFSTFVNEGAKNFYLQAGSPALTAGTSGGIVGAFGLESGGLSQILSRRHSGDD